MQVPEENFLTAAKLYNLFAEISQLLVSRKKVRKYMGVIKKYIEGSGYTVSQKLQFITVN